MNRDRVSTKILGRLAVLNLRDKLDSQDAPEEAKAAAPASTEALMRVRKGFDKRNKRRFTLVDPTRSSARDLTADGMVKPCPRGCGPMTEVELHGKRRGVTCLSCYVTEPLEEMHIVDAEN